MSDKQSEGYKVICDNRQARFLYEIIETYEAGVQLTGTEVKSIRAGKANLQDGYALLRDGEAWLINVHISPYALVVHTLITNPDEPANYYSINKNCVNLLGGYNRKV